MKDGDLFERKEVKLWLNHEKNYDLKSNFMFEENTIKIDWRTISEHLKKTIIHAINQRETKFENIYLVFSHKYSNECIQKISHCMEVNKNQDQNMLLGIFLLIWCRQQMILRIIIDHGLGKNLVIRAALEISEMTFHEGCNLIHVKVNVWNVICIN